MVSLAPLLSPDNAARRAAEAAFDAALEREPDAAANSLAATLDPDGLALRSANASPLRKDGTPCTLGPATPRTPRGRALAASRRAARHDARHDAQEKDGHRIGHGI